MAKEQRSTLKFENLYARIEKGEIDSVYFLNGDEEYIKIEFLKLLRRKLFGDQSASANVEKIAAVAGSAPRIIDLASDYSLFSGGRLVIVYDVQRISTNGQEMLVSFLPSLPEGNHIVMFGPPTFDRRRKFYKYLTSEACWSTLRGLSENTAPFWIKKKLAKYGITATQKAIDLLIRYVGNSYGLLANQIDKLAIALGDKQQLDEEDIEKHTAVAAEYEVFRLLDFVDRRDRTRALEVLHRLLDKSDGMRSVLFFLTRHFMQHYYLAANGHVDAGSEIARQLSFQVWKLSEMQQVARRRSVNQWEECIRAITQAEVALRFEHIPQRLVIENLVISLTREN